MSLRGDVALIGWGAIGRSLARLLAEGGSGARIIAVAVRDPARPRPDLPPGAALMAGPEALAGLPASLVIEAAGRAAVAPWGRAALAAGMDFAVSSTSAFADADLLAELTGLARAQGCQLVIPPGALGGIDALAAAARMGLEVVEHRIIKPPRAWAGTEAEILCDLHELTAPTDFFAGPADEAAARFPQNANVALITALAGLGVARSRVVLVADPGADTNRHEVTASGSFGRMRVVLANAPLPDNPRTSAMTALSLARLVENRVNPLVI